MGWLYPYGASKKQVIETVTKGWDNDRSICLTLKHCVRGNVVWTVQETLVKETGQIIRWIGCYLLASSEGSWGYKSMDESMGPFYYSCPLSYLEMVPKVENKDWRDEVKKHHANRKSSSQGLTKAFNSLKDGQSVLLHLKNCKPKEMTLKSVRPLRATHKGTIYRVPRKYIDRFEIKEGGVIV